MGRNYYYTTMNYKHTIIATLSASSILLSSCATQTINPYTGQQQNSKAVSGAAMGAVAGGLIGALSGKNRSGGRKRHALKGAVLGALAGGGIGAYMDNQEAQIRRQMEGTGVSVTRSGNDLILNMPSDITFNTGSARIRPRFTETLRSVALILKKYKKTSISITGHTDSVGSSSFNQGLSVSRANSVASTLHYQGVQRYRTLTNGRGENSPVASNATARGKAKNRRVELRIVPQQNQFR